MQLFFLTILAVFSSSRTFYVESFSLTIDIHFSKKKMTITAAWVRTLKDCKELIVISDSRLNGGKKMDCGQKVHMLPRSDAFICFAGDTSWAYPLMHQVISAVSTYERSANRAQDIVELKSHVLKVFEGLREAIHDAIGGEEIPSAEFLFRGYSWIRKKFLIWRIHFQKGMNSFEANPAKEWKDLGTYIAVCAALT